MKRESLNPFAVLGLLLACLAVFSPTPAPSPPPTLKARIWGFAKFGGCLAVLGAAVYGIVALVRDFYG
jgi:hypothetical protein